MDISTNSLFAQMQSMSLQASGNKLPAVGGDMEGISGVNSASKVNHQVMTLAIYSLMH